MKHNLPGYVSHPAVATRALHPRETPAAFPIMFHLLNSESTCTADFGGQKNVMESVTLVYLRMARVQAYLKKTWDQNNSGATHAQAALQFVPSIFYFYQVV